MHNNRHRKTDIKQTSKISYAQQQTQKKKKIIIILKSGDSNPTVNYNPISMLPFLSKMVEIFIIVF